MIDPKEIAKWVEQHFDELCSLYNIKENKEFNPRHVLGIITPFKAQVAEINKALYKSRPDGWAEAFDLISVGTVHTFQGSERKVIIFSSVYGNLDGCYFIDKRKNLMNVAISRAKDSFLHFGSRGCLIGGETSASGLMRIMVCESLPKK